MHQNEYKSDLYVVLTCSFSLLTNTKLYVCVAVVFFVKFL